MFIDAAVPDALLRGLILAPIGLIWVIAQIRFVGLRALSKMTSFDFVVTVAMGSLLAGASQAATWSSFFQAAAAMASLFVMQLMVAHLRQTSDAVEAAIQNQPVLLMRNGEIFDEALQARRVARGDLIAKLREANVLDLSEVRAVVLEATGDISVLHGKHLDETLLSGVQIGNS